MTSSNGNIFRVTGHLCGEFTGPRWIPRTQRPVTRSFDVCFDLRLNKNREAGDLRRHRAHYDVIVKIFESWYFNGNYIQQVRIGCSMGFPSLEVAFPDDQYGTRISPLWISHT